MEESEKKSKNLLERLLSMSDLDYVFSLIKNADSTEIISTSDKINELMGELDKSKQIRFRKTLVDACYNRMICHEIRANYCVLKKEDIARIRILNYWYLVRKEEIPYGAAEKPLLQN